MYRAKQAQNLATQYKEFVQNKVNEQNTILKSKAEKNIEKILNDALSKIDIAAKKGRYWIEFYSYSRPWYRFLCLNDNLWNEISRNLLQKKLQELGFNCVERSGLRLEISWYNSN